MMALVEKKSKCGIGWDLRSEGEIGFIQISNLTSPADNIGYDPVIQYNYQSDAFLSRTIISLININ